MLIKILRRTLLFLILSSAFFSGRADNFDSINIFGGKIIGWFKTHQFDSISMQFDSMYKSYYKPEVFEGDWEELNKTYGQLQSYKPVDYDEGKGYFSISYLMNFAYLPQVLNLSMNENRKLLYLSFMPAHTLYVAPPYVDVSRFSEIKVDFGSDPYFFTGILSKPKTSNKTPLVIIIGEAGPTDKDFSFNINKPYKDFANGFASQGVACFRFDKRTFTYGMYLLNDRSHYVPFTCREEYLDDLYKAIDVLKKRSDIDTNRIYILGHGQGGMLLPLVATERKDVKGIIMLGANSLKTQEMMIDQYAYLSKVTPDKKEEYDEQSRKARYSLKPDLYEFELLDSMPYGVQPSYWIWLNKYDHVATLQKLQKPVIIMHGERDYQVSMRNLKLWQQSLKKNTNVLIKSYPKLNHMFMEGEVESTYSEYYIKGNIPKYIIDDISSWIEKNNTNSEQK